jgi:alginate O-acetyltransferase complex protein AlgJ
MEMSREAIASREIGRTAIGPRSALLVSAVFLLLIFSVPVGQFFLDLRQGTRLPQLFGQTAKSGSLEPPWSRLISANRAFLHALHNLENHLEETTVLREIFLPPLQLVLYRYLGQGNEQVVLGREKELFYAPDIDALIGPPFLDPHHLRQRSIGHEIWEIPVTPDPRPAILAFRNQLAEREIELLLVPVPSKAAIEPEKLTGRKTDAPLANRSWADFSSVLAGEGVRIFDGRQLLREYAEEHDGAFLASDSHWSPGAMAVFAEALATWIAFEFPDLPSSLPWQRRGQEVRGVGDIGKMLILPPGKESLFRQEVTTEQILTGGEEFWQADPAAEILLLGDSFTNIYSLAGLGWGRGAGLAEQLSYFLARPIDLLARNDGGAHATREMLATELHRGRDRLAGKKLVIWQFAERELQSGDWKQLDLRLGELSSGDFFLAPADEPVVVDGVVAAIARSPRPGSVPYRDNLLSLHLVDLSLEDGEDRQALVYAWGMRDNQLTAVAGLRPGDRVRFALQSWEAVTNELAGYRRTSLDDPIVELELPNWGTLLDAAY